MEELFKKKCVACDGNTIPFDTSEIHKYLKKIDGWEVKNTNEKNYYLEKKFNHNTYWSGQRDSNPRPSRWQRDALPLSYARKLLVNNLPL